MRKSHLLILLFLTAVLAGGGWLWVRGGGHTGAAGGSENGPQGRNQTASSSAGATSSSSSSSGRLAYTAKEKKKPAGKASMGGGLPKPVAAGKLVEQAQGVSVQGRPRRVSVYRTGFKYPLLRVEEPVTPPATLPGKPVTSHPQVMVADHVMVRLAPGADPATLAAQLAGQGMTILKNIPNSPYYLVQIPDSSVVGYSKALNTLGQAGNAVQYAEPDYVVQATGNTTPLIPNDPDFSQLWGLYNTGNNPGTSGGVAGADIHAPQAWNVTTGNHSIVVAVIDTGIEYTHPDLSANVWCNPNPTNDAGYPNDTMGWNFVAGTNDPLDDNGHGSHVSGTIGAVGNNDIGVTGVNQTIQIMPLKFLDASGSGADSDAIEAILFATAHGVFAMSNSWGGGGYSQAMKDAIDSAGAQGIGFIAAAGNYGDNNDSAPEYPAAYASTNLIAVAATDDTDTLADFSNFGPTTVHLGAPGVDIVSTYVGGTYATLSGTSMATPHVSGSCALVKAANLNLSFAQIKQAVLATVDPLSSLKGVTITGGRMNLAKAVTVGTNPYPVITATQIDDKSSDGWTGNGNGIIEPGETVGLTVTLQNIGGVALSNAQATLSLQSANANLTLTNTTMSLGNIPINGVITNASAPFSLSVAPGTPTPLNVPMNLTVTDTQGDSWTLALSVSVYSISTVSGQVTTVTGGNAISGATVQVKGSSTGTSMSAITAADGTYSLPLINDTYAVTASAAGFNTSAITSVTVPPSSANVNFQLGTSTAAYSTTSLTATQLQNDVTTQTFTITNNGDLPYTYQIQQAPSPSNLTGTALPRLAATSATAGRRQWSRASGAPVKLKGENWSAANRRSPGALVRAKTAAVGGDPTQAPLASSVLANLPLKAASTRALSTSVQTLPFFDGFEYPTSQLSANWFTGPVNGGTCETVTDHYLDGLRSFHFQNTITDPTNDAHFCGIYGLFYEAQPGYIAFWVRPGTDSAATSYFVVTDLTPDGPTQEYIVPWIWFFANEDGRFYLNNDVGGNETVQYQPDTWYHIEFRNLDWTNKAFDYYVNGSLIQAAVPFRNPTQVSGLAAIFMYNFSSGTDAWYDDVQVSANPLNWLSAAPLTGTIAPGASATVTVTFDATGLDVGTFTGNLLILSNDSNNPQVTIPVTLNVQAVPPPVADPQTVTTTQDTAVLMTLTGSSPVGHAVTFKITQPPTNGVLYQTDGYYFGAPITDAGTLVSNGMVAFMPNPHQTGTPYTTFQFEAMDVQVPSDPAACTINVSAVYSPPTANTVEVSALPGQTLASIPVLANVLDYNGGADTLVSVTNGSFGTAVANADGTVTYTPAATYFWGDDAFTYSVTDGTSTVIGQVVVHMGHLLGGDWPTLGRDTGRSGYYPSQRGGRQFVPRWNRAFTKTTTRPVVANGSIYLTLSDANLGGEVQSLALSSGQTVWSAPLGNTLGINPLTYDSGALFLQYAPVDTYYNTGIDDLTGLMSLDAGSGQTYWNNVYYFPTGGCSAAYGPPLLTPSMLYLGTGGTPGLLGMDRYFGQPIFYNTLTSQIGWTPTLGDASLLNYVGTAVTANDLNTGAVIGSLTPAVNTATGATATYSKGIGVVIANGQVSAFNAVSGQMLPLWSASDSNYMGMPAIANGRVYALTASPDNVRVLDLHTGNSIATYSLPGMALQDQPIVCDDSLVIPGVSSTYVLNLADGSLAQTLPVGGPMALAGGMLLVQDLVNQISWAFVLPPELSTNVLQSNSTAPVNVVLATNLGEAVIHFTTDGSTPTAASPVVPSGASLPIEHTVDLKAVAILGSVMGDSREVLVTIADTNGQGLPDWWQMQYFGQLGVDPSAHGPSGLTNYDAFVMGINPTLSQGLGVGVTPSASGGTGPTVSWQSTTDRFYSVQSSPDLIHWDTLSSPTLGTGGTMTYQDTTAGSANSQFYRISVTMP